MTIKILIADDHGVLRAGLRSLLSSEPDIRVVGEASDGEQAIYQVNQFVPDILLLDISMPGLSGIEVTRRLRLANLKTRVLILTLHEDASLLREAIRAGASGYITKRAVDVDLINAIRTIARGELYVHPNLTYELLKDISPLNDPQANETSLTPRELQVLRLIVKGYTNRQIADELSLSVRTVDTHRANIMDKLGLHSRAELVQYAREHSLN